MQRQARLQQVESKTNNVVKSSKRTEEMVRHYRQAGPFLKR